MKAKIFNLSNLLYALFLFSILLAPSDVKAQTYGTVPMGGGGFISGIITSKTEKNLMYIRTDVGGAYRWGGTENTWIPLTDWVSAEETGYLGVEAIALDPKNSDNLYMSVGISYFNNGKSAILRSKDKGKTFSITDVTNTFRVDGNGMGRNTGEKLAVDPNLGSILLCGSRSQGLFKSADSGVSWTKLNSLNVTSTPNGNGISFVIFDPSTGSTGTATNTIIIGVSRTGENLYVSTDGGTSFNAISGSPTALMPMRAALASNRTLYITYANAEGPYNPNTGQIWKYDLAKSTWTNITPTGYTSPFCGISVDPNNPARVLASTINVYMSQPPTDGDRFFLSTNGGTSWIDLVNRGFKYDPNGNKWNDFGKIHWAGSIEFDPFDTKRAFVISGNGLFNTDNIDSTINVWKFNYRGIEETVPYDIISIAGGPIITIVADYDGCRNSDINTYGPQLRPSMGTSNSVAYATLNPKVVARVGSSVHISADTGKTWNSVVSKGTQGYVAVSADGKTIMHTPKDTYNSYRSQDNGATWSTVKSLDYLNGKIVADQVNPSVFYSVSLYTGKMMVSFNSGATFFATADPGGNSVKHIRTVPGKEGHIWVPLQNDGLSRSVNYGTSFIKVTSVSACNALGLGKEAPGAEYPSIYIWGKVGGTEGLFMSTDEGATWNRLNDDAHEWGGPGNAQFVNGDLNTAGLAYMSTAGRGIIWAKADYMLSSESLNISVGNTTQIKLSVLNGDTLTWTWTSGNTTSATVDQNGLLTGAALGTSVITATSGNRVLKIGVNVINPVTSFVVTPDKDSIDINEQIQLTATVTPATTITWASANPSVATVSSAGLVTGKKAGKTVIVITAGEKVIRVPIKVGVEATGLSLAPASATIKIWEKIKLVATLTPENTSNKKITWLSANAKIALVDTNGIVSGVSKGKVDITATSADGFVQTAKITVSADTTTSSINQANGYSDIPVYPNPIDGKRISIDLSKLSGQTVIKLIDINGQTVMNKAMTNNQLYNIDIDLKPGVYLIHIENEKAQIVKKIIIK